MNTPLSFTLTGKVAIVTGGTSGIGQATVEALANAGAKVVTGSSSTAKVEAAQAHFQEIFPNQVIVQTCDVSCEEQRHALLQTAIENFGGLDILVNCAGVNLKKPTAEIEPEELDRVMDINFRAPFFMCQAFYRAVTTLPTFDAAQDRCIINICSVTSHSALSEVTAYACSKSAMLGLTRQLAVEWTAQGIRCAGISPGFVPADQNIKILKSGDRGRRILENTPMTRFGSPQEIASAAVYLASPAGQFVNGTTIQIDGGFLACGVCSNDAQQALDQL